MSDMNKLLEETIKASMVASMASIKDDLLAKLVDNLLNKKVDANGNEPRYSGDAKYTYLDHLFQNQLRLLVEQCIREYMRDNEAEMSSLIKSHLLKEDGFIVKMTEGLTEQLKDGNLYVSVNLQAHK